MDRDNQRDKPVAMAHGSLPGAKALFAAVERGVSVDQEQTVEVEWLDNTLSMLKNNLTNGSQTISNVEAVSLISDLQKARREKDKAIKVLRWYAAKQTYMLGVNVTLSLNFPNQEPILTDKGDMARTILKELGAS